MYLCFSYVKLKMEKEHTVKVQADKIKLLEEQCAANEEMRVRGLKEEEQIWQREVKEEGDRRQREIDRLQVGEGGG